MSSSSKRPCRAFVSALDCLAFAGTLGYALASPPQTPQEPAPTPPPATPLTATQLFTERGCAHCHQWNGNGGHKGPDLSSVGRRLSATEIRKQIDEGGGTMPAFEDALPASEIDALVELLHRSRKNVKPSPAR